MNELGDEETRPATQDRKRDSAGAACATASIPTTTHLQIQLLSDLHLEYCDDLPHVEPAAPFLALLGDIGYARAGPEGEKLKAFLLKQSEQFKQIFLVKGNHELFGTSRDEAVVWLRNAVQAIPNLVFLDRDSVEVYGVRILGCTLWSRLPKQHWKSAWSMMRDFDQIQDLCLKVDENAAMSGDMAMVMNAKVSHGCIVYDRWYCEDVDWLREEVEKARVDVANGEISSALIFTHHAPLTEEEAVCERSRALSGHSIGCEGTNLYRSMLDENDEVVKAWCYGHTHKCFSMRHGDPDQGTLIVTNPMGNPEEEVEGKCCGYCVISLSVSETHKPARKSCKC